MKLPNIQTPVVDAILSESKFWPYFRDAVGAIDCTHLMVAPPEEDKAWYRDRDGHLSQNVLAICSFDMLFQYMLSGWEGSAADSLIFEHAIRRDLVLPEGKYLIADAGFPGCDSLLVPY